MKKSISIIVLVVMMVGLFSTVALARYTYISSVDANLGISGGTATVKGVANAFDSNYITVDLVLERKPSTGGSWSSFDSWSDTSASKVTRFTLTKSCTVQSGYIYRTKATGIVNGEKGTIYSDEIKY